MTSGIVPAAIALAIQLGLGLVVFQANPKRRSNQCFLILSLAGSAWLASLAFGVYAEQVWLADFCIRQASVAGALYLAALNLLRLSIRYSQHGWRFLLRRYQSW